jgi:ribosome-associated heat shock protein Hsp15
MAARDIHNQDQDELRLDKWLWVARFYKTRSLATEAIKGGKVDVNGNKAKPSRAVQIGDELRVRKPPFEHTVIVQGTARFRGPAEVAATLYRETPESIAKRAALAANLKAAAASQPTLRGRPSKRDRRQIVRFTRRQDD